MPEELICHPFLLKLTLTFPLKLEASISPVLLPVVMAQIDFILYRLKSQPIIKGSHTIIDRRAWTPAVAPQSMLLIRTKEVDEPSVNRYILSSKTCLKRPLKKNKKHWFSITIINKCRSKVLQMLQREHSEILSTFIFKFPFSFKTFV